jgi:hypothetical protein
MSSGAMCDNGSLEQLGPYVRLRSYRQIRRKTPSPLGCLEKRIPLSIVLFWRRTSAL